jgi:hypothetical protein
VGVESCADLTGEDQRPVYWKRAVLEVFGECFSLQELHDEKRHVLELADVVNRADVGVRDPGHGSCFTLESLQLHAGRAGGRHDLDRDCPFELRISSAVNLAHPAGADRRQDFVSPDSSSDGERHEGISATRAYSTPT